MSLKKKFLYSFFIIILSTWFVSLLVLSLSTSIWGTRTFPLTINAYVRTIFWVSTVLASSTSFLIGLDELGALSALKNHIKQYFEPKKKQPVPTDKPIIFALIPSETSLEDQGENEVPAQILPDNSRKKPRKGAPASDEE
jgi:hypothetical protein